MYGAIDGSYQINVKPKQTHAPAYYWCQHDAHTILLQIIIDHDK